MKRPVPVPIRASAAKHFRGEIEKAEADGITRGEMTLRLTFGDVSKLKRDHDLALTDISFAEGAMRYLGVRVEQGGVAVSSLDLVAPEPAAAPPSSPPAKAARKPRKTVSAAKAASAPAA